jgi:hypothetical protein
MRSKFYPGNIGRQYPDGVDWIHLAQDGIHWLVPVNAEMNIKGEESFDQLSDCRYLKNSAPAISSSVVYCSQETFLNLTL